MQLTSSFIFVPYFTYNELVTSQVNPQQHKQPANTTTMVMEPLAPPAGWIQWYNAARGAGGLAHVHSEAAVEGFCLIHWINVEINIFLLTLCLIELGLVRRQQWWPKRHPLSEAAAHNIQTSSKYGNRHEVNSSLVLIDHNMVLQLCIMIQKRRWWRTNAPHPPAVLIATAVRRSNTDGIAQCGMSRATLEATGCRHRATTHSVSPQRLPRQQANKQQSTKTPKKLATSMAMAMRRYVTAHIAWWRRLRALLEATKRRHRASIAANRHNRSRMCHFFTSFLIVNLYKNVASRVEGPCFQQGYYISNKREGLN